MFFAWLVIFLPLLTLSLSLSLVIEFFCPFSVSRMNLEIEMDVIDIIKCHVEFSFFLFMSSYFFHLSVVIPLIWYLKVFIVKMATKFHSQFFVCFCCVIDYYYSFKENMTEYVKGFFDWKLWSLCNERGCHSIKRNWRDRGECCFWGILQ